MFADATFMDEEQQQQPPKESLHEQAARKLDSLLTKRVSDEFINALSEHVHQTIDKAIARCTANGRSTLRPEDI